MEARPSGIGPRGGSSCLGSAKEEGLVGLCLALYLAPLNLALELELERGFSKSCLISVFACFRKFLCLEFPSSVALLSITLFNLSRCFLEYCSPARNLGSFSMEPALFNPAPGLTYPLIGCPIMNAGPTSKRPRLGDRLPRFLLPFLALLICYCYCFWLSPRDMTLYGWSSKSPPTSLMFLAASILGRIP